MNNSFTVSYTPKTDIPKGVSVGYNYLSPDEITFNIPKGMDVIEFIKKYGIDVMNEIHEKKGIIK